MANASLSKAKQVKNDEFYTRYDDIQAELNHYRDQFQEKVVYCNCDDPAESAFSDFFKLNFEYYGLKKLICTRYVESTLFTQAWLDPAHRVGYKIEITGKNDCKKINLKGSGDFQSEECIELLKEADIVCTNPPFSLFRKYINQLLSHNKKFLVIGPMNAITYKDFFPHILKNEVWCGYTHPKKFIAPTGEVKSLGNVQWWTNLDTTKRHEDIILYETYSPEKFPKYDNYDAIEVGKVKSIPKDYFGVMGVPITFLDSYNPEQFEILGFAGGWCGKSELLTRKYPTKQTQTTKNGKVSIVGKLNDGTPLLNFGKNIPNSTYYEIGDGNFYTRTYGRILIKRKEQK